MSSITEQMTPPAQMRDYLEGRLPTYLKLLQRMVAVNSFTSNPEGVDHLAGLTAEIFHDLGFRAEMVPSADPSFGHHLVLTREGRLPQRIGLVSHLDTVFPAIEEKQNDFRWRVQGNRIYGPGTVDIKGGTVVIYMMLDVLRQAQLDLFEDTNWVILLDAAEEADGEEFGRLCVERLAGQETKACLIFEGGRVRNTEARVVVARKGMAVFRVSAKGRAAHAGTSHEQGANAIVQLADAIQQIHGFTDYERELTFNVGTLAGGSVVNRVPHFASASVEMRAFDEEVYQHGLEQMLALPQRAAVESPDGSYQCRLQVEVLKQTRPWPRNEATDRLLDVWKEAGRRLGIHVLPEERGGLSDGNYFWDQIPSLDGLGPAGGNAHCSERSADGRKDQEYVRRDSFVPKALLNALGIRILLQGEG